MKIHFIFLLTFCFFELFAQKSVFLLPYAGANFAFSKEFASDPEYKVRPAFGVVNTYGFNLTFDRKKMSYLFGYEMDHVGYATYDETRFTFPNNVSTFQNGFKVSKRAAFNEINRWYFLVKLPVFSKKSKELDTKRFYQKKYFLAGISYDWSRYDFEPNNFVTSNIIDTIFIKSRSNISLWLGTNFEFFSKNKRLFNLQIHFKQGLERLYDIWRFDMNTREVVQIINISGTTCSITLGFPIRIKNF